MELWDLYTKDRRLAGHDHIRGKTIPEGYYHLVVHVWIRNNKGEYLISQRSANRPTYPLMWECVGGSVLKGEDSLTGALRETKEEVGVDLSPEAGRLLFSEVREHFRDIKDVWIFEYNGTVSLENATTDEAAQVKWMSISQIENFLKKGKMVESLGYFSSKVSEFKNNN